MERLDPSEDFRILQIRLKTPGEVANEYKPGGRKAREPTDEKGKES
jgi:hypothetical protein